MFFKNEEVACSTPKKNKNKNSALDQHIRGYLLQHFLQVIVLCLSHLPHQACRLGEHIIGVKKDCFCTAELVEHFLMASFCCHMVLLLFERLLLLHT